MVQKHTWAQLVICTVAILCVLIYLTCKLCESSLQASILARLHILLSLEEHQKKASCYTSLTFL